MRNTDRRTNVAQSFVEQFEACLDAMAEKGTFDAEAEDAIAKHFDQSDEPFGIERAREQVVQRLTDALKETGWALFDTGVDGPFQIQKCDSLAVFDTDEQAIAFVKEKADKGSTHHQEALAKHIQCAKPQVKGTAFQISEEDIENVLHEYWARVSNSRGQSFEQMASELFNEIDHGRVEKAALDSGIDLDVQTNGALKEIKAILVEKGVLEC